MTFSRFKISLAIPGIKFLVKSNNVKSMNYGIHRASFVGSKIWGAITKKIQNINLYEK